MKFTRILFCEACEIHLRPRPYEWYLVHENGAETFLRDKNIHRGEYGFVPHTIEYSETIEDVVFYYVSCGMDECGIRIIKDEEGENQMFGEDNNPVILHTDGKFYHLNENKKAVVYTGAKYFQYANIMQPKLMNCSAVNWQALLNTKFIDL